MQMNAFPAALDEMISQSKDNKSAHCKPTQPIRTNLQKQIPVQTGILILSSHCSSAFLRRNTE
jgi:hypothetical protein